MEKKKDYWVCPRCKRLYCQYCGKLLTRLSLGIYICGALHLSFFYPREIKTYGWKKRLEIEQFKHKLKKQINRLVVTTVNENEYFSPEEKASIKEEFLYEF